MITRLDYTAVNSAAISRMLKGKSDITSFDAGFRAVIELRVSQINGCAYCVDLHSTEARRAGISQQSLDCLPVWREVAFFDEGAKAALAWAEALTRVADEGAPADVFAALQAVFTDREIVDLTLIIAQMNAWNRLAIGFGHLPDPR